MGQEIPQEFDPLEINPETGERKYKQVGDLPKEERRNFSDVTDKGFDGGEVEGSTEGFVRDRAMETLKEANYEANYHNYWHATKQDVQDRLHNDAIRTNYEEVIKSLDTADKFHNYFTRKTLEQRGYFLSGNIILDYPLMNKWFDMCKSSEELMNLAEVLYHSDYDMFEKFLSKVNLSKID